MSVQARILIVAREDALAEPLAEGLDRLGWTTVTARSPKGAMHAINDLQIEAAIVDIRDGGETLELARALKASCAPRRVPVLAIGDPSPDVEAHGFDLTLAAPLHPAQAVLRLETLVRTAVAEEELELRLATFAERGRELDPPDVSKDAYRVLAIGEPAPQFLALSNTLMRMGAEVVGAFTAYTAFDYLHERPFDAVVLWAGESQHEALSIASGMRRNSRLYHIPTLLYLTDDSAKSIGEAFNRGVSDIASLATAEEETARRVIELARAHRRQNAVRQALDKARGSGLMDAATGLFTRDLFAAHLVRLTNAARARNRPLSVCVLRLSDRPEVARARAGGWLERAIPQIGSMIGRLVRAEDTAARLGPELFALALPATALPSGVTAAERISAVISCTAFDAGEGKTPFVADFDIGVAELEPGESAAQALERAAQAALRRAAS